MDLGACLFPPRPRRIPFGRAFQVATRTLHLLAMGMILGGLGMGGTHDTLLTWIWLTVGSGVLLLAFDLWKSCAYLFQGQGVAVLLKLVLLGVGNLFPESRLAWYFAATVVASVGSHMTSAWRHYPFCRLGDDRATRG